MSSPLEQIAHPGWCAAGPSADTSELESELVSLARDAGLFGEPLDQQAMAIDCTKLRAALVQLELQAAGADEESKAELHAEIRLTKEVLMLTEIALLSSGHVAPHL